jgi:hypothetical protein
MPGKTFIPSSRGSIHWFALAASHDGAPNKEATPDGVAFLLLIFWGG